MKSVISLFLVFLILSCTHVDSHTISADTFEKKLKETPGTLIDIRTAEEFEEEHLAGARNINFYDSAFKSKITKLDKSKPLYIYCQKGGRSEKAMKIAEAVGFKEIYELEGGLDNWEDQGKYIEGFQKTPPAEMTKEEFQAIINSQKLVVVDFAAQWCGPCRRLSPLLDKIGKQREKEVKVVKIDVDQNEVIAHHERVEELPTLQWYKNGKLVLRMIGLQTEKEINSTIDKLSKD